MLSLYRRSINSPHKWPHSRCYAAAHQYSETLNLPRTTFPLRPNHIDGNLQDEASKLYRWQRERRPNDQIQHDRHKIASEDRSATEFILHDGPPFANGNLHIGHALNKILKDIIVRRKILEGYKVRYIPGWDCHGLPIELKALQAHQAEISSSDKSPNAAFQRLPAHETRRVARRLASNTAEEQSTQFQKMAICADWESPYRTLDLSYELAQLTVFGDMVERGLIYRAEKPVYWSPSSRTALAEAELEYADDHISHAAFVAYPLVNTFRNLAKVSLLIWTTTPWTLPANRAIAVNAGLEYCMLHSEEDESYFVVARALVDSVKQHITGLAELRGSTFLGEELLNLSYKDVFVRTSQNDNFVLAADYVSADSGTGLVHTAPGHGQEDYLLCQSQPIQIRPFSPVDDAGCYTANLGIDELVGLDVQNEGSKQVMQTLRENGSLLATHKYKHKYPYDWRTKKPIIVRSTPQFFANLSSIKNVAVKSLENLKMVPASGKARLKLYVQGRDEWCISRQRSWGVPIPALFSEDGDLLMSKASIAHIVSVLRNEGVDAWFAADQHSDDWQKWVPENLRNGKKWTRGQETLDVWFDSGCSWTTLQANNTNSCVADLYLEGSDQHRGWFQSSLLTSIATRGIPPYKQVLTHGFVLDHKGHKMSKSVGNVIDPLLIIGGRPASDPMPVDSQVTDKKRRKHLEKFAREAASEIKPLGTDALRLWVAQSDFTGDISVSKGILTHVAESLRKFRTTIRYMIGNLADFDPQATIEQGPYVAIDEYAVEASERFRAEVESNFASYTFNKVVASLNHYTNAQLSAFYFDTLKDRLYADSTEGPSRRSAQRSLFRLLKDYMVVIAPICPLLVAEAWQHLPHRLTGGAAHIYASDWQSHLKSESRCDASAWGRLMHLRDVVNKQLELTRSSRLITTSLQSSLTISLPENYQLPVPDTELANFFIVSDVSVKRTSAKDLSIDVQTAALEKCPRCWTYTAHSPDVLCRRCETAI